jgi:endonuclease/exonuclease/phosphatase family metal-dependent hydrolase
MRRLFTIAAAAAVIAAPLSIARADEGGPVLPPDGSPLCATQSPTAGSGSGGSDVHASRGSGEVRVATYNILHSQGPEMNLLGDRLPLIGEAMVAADADVYGLQEVVGPYDADSDSSDTDEPHVAQQLAQVLADAYDEEWTWCWFMANPHFPGEPDLADGGGGGPLTEAMVSFNPTNPGLRLGEAVLTRFTIDKARSRRMLPRSYETPLCDPVGAATNPLGCPAESVFDAREIMWTQITDTAGFTFDVFNTHVPHHLTEASQITKQIAVEMMLATIDQWEDPATPTFFTGDFNSRTDYQANGELTDRWGTIIATGFHDTWLDEHGVEGPEGWTSDQEIVTTDGATTTDARIDYVFHRCPDGTASATLASSRFADQPTQRPGTGDFLWPSDHLGMVSTAACTLLDGGAPS